MTAKEVYIKTVISRINGDKNHGWGVDDSMAVIAAIFESETGEKLDEEVAKWIKRVINPSQHRQLLEGEKMLNKQETKKQQRENVFAEFNTTK